MAAVLRSSRRERFVVVNLCHKSILANHAKANRVHVNYQITQKIVIFDTVIQWIGWLFSTASLISFHVNTSRNLEPATLAVKVIAASPSRHPSYIPCLDCVRDLSMLPWRARANTFAQGVRARILNHQLPRLKKGSA